MNADALERVYRRLPISVQNLALSVEGWRISRSRYGRDFEAMLELLASRSSWSSTDLEAYRDARLRLQIQSAVAHCAFYDKEPYREASREPSFGLSDLPGLPLIDKSVVRGNLSDIVSREPLKKIWVHTSGTTGAGLRFPTTEPATSEQWAVWWRYRNWHGIARNTWCAHFGGRNVASDAGRHWRIDYAQRRILFSAYHTNEAHLDEYIEALVERRPVWLHGYPSFISLVAHRVLESKVDLGYSVKWVTTGSENLLEYQRVAIRKAFSVDAIQHYGLTEAVANLSQCKLGRLHIDEDFAVVEEVDSRLVGTSLSNPAFPLIRYETGDVGRMRSVPCPCGLPGRTMDDIDGRQEDYLELSDGTRLGRLDHILKDSLTVRSAQFVQERAGFAELLLVGGDDLTESDLDEIRTLLLDRVGGRLSITLKRVETLPLAEGSKHRLVIRR